MTMTWPGSDAPKVKRIALIAEYEDGTAVSFTAEEPHDPTLKISESRHAPVGYEPVELGFARELAARHWDIPDVAVGFKPSLRHGIKFRSLTAADVADTFRVVAPEAPGG